MEKQKYNLLIDWAPTEFVSRATITQWELPVPVIADKYWVLQWVREGDVVCVKAVREGVELC